jgi:hypothetical protein
MLTSILIILCLFHCYDVHTSSIPHIEQDKRELGIRMSLLYTSVKVMMNKKFSFLGFKQAITDAMKKFDDLAISKSICI